MGGINDFDDVWIFGYGSLVWRPNFVFEEKLVGHVSGYDRRFWQGSKFHRGNCKKPGRVVTLVPNDKGRVWGIAYRVCGEKNVQGALSHLTRREQTLGCYDVEFFDFVPKNQPNKRIKVLLYFAKPGNGCYLGEATNLEISKEILTSSGASGYNAEYLFRLAEFMRDYVPEEEEEHLFCIDRIVRKRMGLSTREPTPWLVLAGQPQFVNILESFSIEHFDEVISEEHVPLKVMS